MISLGIMTSRDPEKAEKLYQFAAAHSLSFTELCINIGTDTDNIAEEAPLFLSLRDRYGIPVGAVGRWGAKRLNPDGSICKKELSNDYHLIDFAATLGSPVYNFGVNCPESMQSSCGDAVCECYKAAEEYVGLIVEKCASYNIAPAVVNCDWGNFIYTPKAWDYFLSRFPTLGIKYDPSHAYYRNADIMAEMRDYAERFRHFHIKGAIKIGATRFDDPPAGFDDFNWGAIFGMLYSRGYNGGASIEPHSGRWKGALGEAGTEFTVNYMKKYILNY